MAVRKKPPSPKKTSSQPRGVTTDLEQIKEILAITPELDLEMARQAALYSQFAIAAVLAEDRMDRLKTQLTIFEAQADGLARQQLIKSGEKMREASVTAIIHMRADWKQLNSDILDALEDYYHKPRYWITIFGAIPSIIIGFWLGIQIKKQGYKLE